MKTSLFILLCTGMARAADQYVVVEPHELVLAPMSDEENRSFAAVMENGVILSKCQGERRFMFVQKVEALKKEATEHEKLLVFNATDGCSIPTIAENGNSVRANLLLSSSLPQLGYVMVFVSGVHAESLYKGLKAPSKTGVEGDNEYKKTTGIWCTHFNEKARASVANQYFCHSDVSIDPSGASLR